MHILIRLGLLLATMTLALATRPCTLCPDASSTTYPEKVIILPPLPPVTCKVAETSVPIVMPDDTSDECKLTQQISTICGCPKKPDACSLCPDGSAVSNKDTELPMFNPITPDSLFTCELMEAYLHSFSNNEGFCPYAQRQAAEICGCPATTSTGSNDSMWDEHNTTTVEPEVLIFDATTIRYTFFGATTGSKMDILHWVELLAAMLSIVGALVVIQDNLRNKKRRKNLYNQIITVMALFDIIQAVAIAFQDTPVPRDSKLGTDGNIGNQATCKAQGWAIQFGGLTSLFLNVSLSTYFLLVIVYRSRESQLKKMRKWLLGLPILVGFIFAGASLPFISRSLHGCHMTPPNAYLMEAVGADGFSTSWAPYLCLYIIPGFSVLIYTTGALVRVFFFVRNVSRQGNKWRFEAAVTSLHTKQQQQRQQSPPRRMQRRLSTSSVNSVQNEVFWQSAMYLSALYLAWFTQLIILVQLEKYLAGHYALWVFFSFITPLQGFMNALVYFRPRMARTITRLSKQGACTPKRYCYARKRNQASSQQEVEETNSEVRNAWLDIRAAEPAADIVQLFSVEDDDEVLSLEEGTGEVNCGSAISHSTEEPAAYVVKAPKPTTTEPVASNNSPSAA